MPSAREVAALEGEISQLEGTVAALRTHKDHFDTLISEHEGEGSRGGFFAGLRDALEGLVNVIDDGIFGSDSVRDARSGGGDKGRGIGIHSAVLGLQSAGDTTEAERGDTMAHLRQVASDIQVRLDDLGGQIDDKRTRLKALRSDGPIHRVDPVIPVVSPHPDEPVAPVTPPAPHVPIVSVDPVRRPDPVDDPKVIPFIDIPDVRPVVVTPSLIDDITTNVVVVPVHAPDYTPTYDPTVQAEIGELDGEIYDVEALLRSGKSVADLRARDIPAGILTAFGVGAGALIGGGFPVPELREAGLDAATLRNAGVTVVALREAGYGIDELRAVATVAELRTVASADVLHAACFSATELRDTFPASDLVRIYSIHELKDAGFRIDELRELVVVSELRTAFDVSELAATFSPRDLHDAGVSAVELLHAGTSLSSLRDAGFSYLDLVHAGGSANELATLYPYEASVHDGSVSSGGY